MKRILPKITITLVLVINLLCSCEKHIDSVCVECINLNAERFEFCGGKPEAEYFFNKLNNDSTHCKIK